MLHFYQDPEGPFKLQALLIHGHRETCVVTITLHLSPHSDVLLETFGPRNNQIDLL